jgi:phenylalanyl-tRNA synthetase beta chain
MRVPVSLLRRFVPIPVDLDTLVRTLNARVSEIEHIHRFPSRESFAGVRIVELSEALEGRDGHTRWRSTGGAHIVVGDAFRVAAGERYAAVIAGGSLPDGTTVAARTVAGMASDGALVSEAMLGVGKDAARPLRFAPDTEVGADAWTALELDDVVLEFDLEPNRPDLFSLVGVARDVSAIWDVPFTPPTGLDLSGLPALASPSLHLETPRARAYLALEMRGLRVGPSPQWLQNAVRKLGMRPINNVVDAANLAMFELGEPMHTFDRARLQSDRIVLRMARGAEKITTLDAIERTLTDECLLVCDGDRPVAVAGVMGDATSEVHEGTTDVIVEVAAFDMAAVRRASRRLALRTEASLRFEKGLPVSRIEPAAARLAELLAAVAGAEPVALARAGERAQIPAPVAYRRDGIRARLGVDVPDAVMDRLLTATGSLVQDDTVIPPEFRPDLRIPEDYIEEVGRLFGYEHVQAASPRIELGAPRVNPLVALASRVRRLFTAHGFDEVYLPVWIGEAEVERYALPRERLIALTNPLAENYSFFRLSSLPHLVDAAVQNRKELDRFALFELGRSYARAEDGTIDERPHLGALATHLDVRAARDLLVALGSATGADVSVARDTHPHLHPGRTVSVGGWAVAGELHPRLARAAGLREAPTVILADLGAIVGGRAALVRFVPPPRFPGVTLDVNVTVGPQVEAAAVLGAVPTVDDLVRAEVIDVYALPSGARLTLRCSFNAGTRSLTAEEAQQRMATVRESLSAAGHAVA